MLNLKIIATNDGSKTIKIPQCNEHYHSIHGAISEAQHVYIKNGLDLIISQRISIFEMGFGTGLNAFLTYLYGFKNQRTINYYAIEKEPLSLEIVNQLDYVDLLGAFSEEHIFIKLHTSSWDMLTEISTHFHLNKIHNTIQEYEFDTTFDLIFYDAFGFRVQPELWQKDIFDKLVKTLNRYFGNILQKEVKRILKYLGMQVESLQDYLVKRNDTSDSL